MTARRESVETDAVARAVEAAYAVYVDSIVRVDAGCATSNFGAETARGRLFVKVYPDSADIVAERSRASRSTRTRSRARATGSRSRSRRTRRTSTSFRPHGRRRPRWGPALWACHLLRSDYGIREHLLDPHPTRQRSLDGYWEARCDTIDRLLGGLDRLEERIASLS